MSSLSSAGTPKQDSACATARNRVYSLQTQRNTIKSLGAGKSEHDAEQIVMWFEPTAQGIKCKACHTTGIRNDNLREHVEGGSRKKQGKQTKHAVNVDEALKRMKSQPKLKAWIAKNMQDGRLKEEQILFRFRLVQKWCAMNIALCKLNDFADWIMDECEENIPDRSHLAKTYIPLVHSYELDELCEFLSKCTLISVIFDGTCRKCENFAIIFRFVYQRRWCQKLVKLGRYEAGFNAEKLAAVLLTVITAPRNRGFGIDPKKVVAMIADRASVNECALGTTPGTNYILRTMIQDEGFYLAIGCSSHTGTHAAEAVMTECKIFYVFWHIFIGCLSRSTKAQASFRRHCLESHPQWSKTRWFGERDSIKDMQALLTLIVQWVFIAEADFEGTPDSSNYNKLRNICLQENWGLSDHGVDPLLFIAAKDHWFMVRFEMACIVAFTEALHLFVYNLEGDYSVAWWAWDECQKVCMDYQTKQGTLAYDDIQLLISERLNEIPVQADKDLERDRLVQYGQRIWAPAQSYFETHFLNQDAPLFQIYRTYEQARLCNPDHIRRLVLNQQFTVGIITPLLDVLLEKRIVVDTAADIATFPDRAIFSQLIAEMSAYALACQGETYGGMTFKEKAAHVDNFWREENDFPAWTKLAHHLALLQASSAAAERVFSRLIAILRRPGMDSALIDNIEAVLMLMYNSNKGFDWEDDAN